MWVNVLFESVTEDSYFCIFFVNCGTFQFTGGGSNNFPSTTTSNKQQQQQLLDDNNFHLITTSSSHHVNNHGGGGGGGPLFHSASSAAVVVPSARTAPIIADPPTTLAAMNAATKTPLLGQQNQQVQFFRNFARAVKVRNLAERLPDLLFISSVPGRILHRALNYWRYFHNCLT